MATKAHTGKKEKQTQVLIAYERLRMMIITQQLRSNGALSEQECADILDMSRTPVREAFQRLKHEGLIQIVPHKGAYVRQLSPIEILHNYELAEALEGMIVFLATENLTDTAIHELDHYVNEMERAEKAQDVELWVRSDESFHDLIIDHCENTVLGQQRRNLQGQIFRSRMLKTMPWLDKRASNVEHKRIVSAIRKRDAELARSEIHRHWQRVRADFRRHM